MKFNNLVVLSNPPYNESGSEDRFGASRFEPLYHKFVESVIDHLKPDYTSFIIPSRWMVGGLNLEKFRKRMMNDSRISKLVHFPGELTVFPSVHVAGGVSYFLWDKSYSGECDFYDGYISAKRFLNSHDIILQDNSALNILEKVQRKATAWVSDTSYGVNPFMIFTHYKGWQAAGMLCYCAGMRKKFVDPSVVVDKNGILGKWKVCTGKANGAAQEYDGNGQKKVLGEVFLVGPNEVCTETYLVIKSFDSVVEAQNFVIYAKGKFFRFMLGLRVSGQNISKEKFSWVPEVDNTRWWCDRDLYDKFSLTESESDYIESKIR